MKTAEFYSNGKLLLTGEYIVLDGAKALAFPCKFGQSLSVKESNAEDYAWTSYLRTGEVWQKVNFSLDDLLENNSKSDFEKRLFQVLKVVYDSKPEIFNSIYDFSTKLGFEKDWGLGSSSTLINNVAQWADIDAYHLLKKTFGGSGYDIAAASLQSPFIYRRNQDKIDTNPIIFPEVLKPHLFFVYLNQKQNSRQAIAKYRKTNQNDNSKTINKINDITQTIIKTHDLSSFEFLLESHENIISELIGQEPVKYKKFSDYNAGIVKSLGAWGGDFVLVTAKQKSDLDYFNQKGFKTIFGYDQMVF